MHKYCLAIQIILLYKMNMSIDNWKSQLRKGAAELALLAMLDAEPLSGLGVVDMLATMPEIGLAGGSVYPLLNRLEREGRISGNWQQPEAGGRALKIYTLTKDGGTTLAQMRHEWCGFRDQLSQIVGET